MNTRQQEIAAMLEKKGEMTIREMTELFGVTAMTIHRDLDFLEKEKILFKKRGAAVFVNPYDRSVGNGYDKEKKCIGRRAAALVRPGQSVIFDNSTTAMEAARFMRGIPGLTFYTTNLEVASIVSDYPDTVLYCSGGYYFKDSRGFVGSQTEAFVSGIHADICFTGTSGIDVENGFTGPYPLHTALQKKILQVSKRRLVLADHSKFDKCAMEKIAALCDVDMIITDRGMDIKTLEKYRKFTAIEIADEI